MILLTHMNCPYKLPAAADAAGVAATGVAATGVAAAGVAAAGKGFAYVQGVRLHL